MNIEHVRTLNNAHKWFRAIFTILLVGVIIVASGCGRDTEDEHIENAHMERYSMYREGRIRQNYLDEAGYITWEDGVDELGTRNGTFLHSITQDIIRPIPVRWVTESSSAWIQFLDEIKAEYGEGSVQHRTAVFVQSELLIEADIALMSALDTGREITLELIYNAIRSAWDDIEIDENLVADFEVTGITGSDDVVNERTPIRRDFTLDITYQQFVDGLSASTNMVFDTPAPVWDGNTTHIRWTPINADGVNNEKVFDFDISPQTGELINIDLQILLTAGMDGTLDRSLREMGFGGSIISTVDNTIGDRDGSDMFRELRLNAGASEPRQYLIKNNIQYEMLWTRFTDYTPTSFLLSIFAIGERHAPGHQTVDLPEDWINIGGMASIPSIWHYEMHRGVEIYGVGVGGGLFMHAFWLSQDDYEYIMSQAIMPPDNFHFDDGNVGTIVHTPNSIVWINGWLSIIFDHPTHDDRAHFIDNEELITAVARTLHDVDANNDNTIEESALVGRWELDYFTNYFGDGQRDAFYGWFAGGELIEFFADGSGVDITNLFWTFTWSSSPHSPWVNILTMYFSDFEKVYSYVVDNDRMYFVSDGPDYIAFRRIH